MKNCMKRWTVPLAALLGLPSFLIAASLEDLNVAKAMIIGKIEHFIENVAIRAKQDLRLVLECKEGGDGKN